MGSGVGVGNGVGVGDGVGVEVATRVGDGGEVSVGEASWADEPEVCDWPRLGVGMTTVANGVDE